MKDIESNVQAGSSNSTGLKEQNDFVSIDDVMSEVSDEDEVPSERFFFDMTSNLMNWRSLIMISILMQKMMFAQRNQLQFLFRWCIQCGAPCEISKIVSTGASISVNTNCDHENNRNSLAKEGQFHEVHVTLAASILLSGLSYQRFSEAMEIGNIEVFRKDTFYRLQKKFLLPSINNVYVRQARKLIEELKHDEIVSLIGDGRCDSPGYRATYGTYSLVNEKGNKIAHVKIVDSSQGMEKYGLEYSIKYFESCGEDIWSA